MTGTIREIAQLGAPVLRAVASHVPRPFDRKISELIEDLQATMVAANGVGIAAPQIFESQRLFIVASRPNPRYPDAPLMEPIAMINPRIVERSGDLVKGWEGCLSIPGIRGFVPRYPVITVEFYDRTGDRRTERLTDFIARIFQHEFDHLEGIVFLDRLDSTKDIVTDQEYMKLSA